MERKKGQWSKRLPPIKVLEPAPGLVVFSDSMQYVLVDRRRTVEPRRSYYSTIGQLFTGLFERLVKASLEEKPGEGLAHLIETAQAVQSLARTLHERILAVELPPREQPANRQV